MAAAIIVTDKNFQNEVLQSDTLFVVNFWVDWVGSCHIITPVLEEVSNRFGHQIRVGNFNIDENKKIPTLYGIGSVPTLLFFNDGEVVKQHTGIISKKDLGKEVSDLLKENQ